jgi:hypothetical protein
MAVLPLRRKACSGFASPSIGFEPANLVSNGKLANHYTTDGTDKLVPTSYLKENTKLRQNKAQLVFTV